MQTKNKLILLTIAVIALAGVLAGPIMSDVEQPKYTVVESYKDIEIRDYEPLVTAEVEVTGPRKKAISDGFNMIADYIFGNNATISKISMTAPVTQQLSFTPEVKKPKKKLTAQQLAEAQSMEVKKAYDYWGVWKVRFVMPANYTLATLPKPVNDAVVLKQIKNARFAVIRFAGLAESDSLREKTNQLNSFLIERNLKSVGLPIYAFYNPPWTLSPLRRNEVLIEVAK